MADFFGKLLAWITLAAVIVTTVIAVHAVVARLTGGSSFEVCPHVDACRGI